MYVKCLFRINSFLVLFIYGCISLIMDFTVTLDRTDALLGCFSTGAYSQHLSIGDNLLLISLEQTLLTLFSVTAALRTTRTSFYIYVSAGS